ncbi:hypothetical protein [Hydrocarboniphaga effusa]|uniref:hypothetical protein n=1 Tax=Hydrocarboniphaga effusa TaxID=243629 RepID=UPI00398BC38F
MKLPQPTLEEWESALTTATSFPVRQAVSVHQSLFLNAFASGHSSAEHLQATWARLSVALLDYAKTPEMDVDEPYTEDNLITPMRVANCIKGHIEPEKGEHELALLARLSAVAGLVKLIEASKTLSGGDAWRAMEQMIDASMLEQSAHYLSMFWSSEDGHEKKSATLMAYSSKLKNAALKKNAKNLAMRDEFISEYEKRKKTEPPRESRRLVGLSAHAATADCSASWR